MKFNIKLHDADRPDMAQDPANQNKPAGPRS